MKFAEIAALISLLVHTYGEITPPNGTHFQEDCAGCGNLTAGVRLFHLVGARRDVLWVAPRGLFIDLFDFSMLNLTFPQIQLICTLIDI